ncbi:MAG: cell division topological specificity factor MinE [Candidatus Competibacterales bacterium]|nr:cell division topological specificity factor MinE [Candidatus Competibacterales bacterium]
MRFIDLFRGSTPPSSARAKERLQIIVAREGRNATLSADYLQRMQQELLAVVRKYVAIEQDQIKVNLDREKDCEVLELNITLPDSQHGARKQDRAP